MASICGREKHAQAEHAREKEQDFLKSLQLIEEALIIYEKDNDLRGFSEALQSRSSAYKHLYQETETLAYIILAKHDALAGIEIAEGLDDKSSLAMVYQGAGKIYEQLRDWQNAAKYFSKAIEAFTAHPPEENNRPAVLSDMNAHYAFDLYNSGEKKKGLALINKSIQELEKNTEEPKYNRDVWLSGAHMRAATMLTNDNPDLASKYLSNAKEIISKNDELKLRARQLIQLETFLETNTSNK